MVCALLAGADQSRHYFADRRRCLELISAGADGDVKPRHIRTVVDRNPVITDIPKVSHTRKRIGDAEARDSLGKTV